MNDARIQVVDSHTAGEPTRVVINGGPELGVGPLTARLDRFRTEHDHFRSAVVNEPRGSDVLVGALLMPPHDPACHTAVIFFNNVGFLGMCGHGMIGVITTLAYLGRLEPGEHAIETPVGVVRATLETDGLVAIQNVPSYRRAKSVTVDVVDVGPVTGDVAWGGNWFFLVEQPDVRLEVQNVEQLTDLAWRIRQAVNAAGFPEVDHVELFGPATLPGADVRNFVLCPGKAYDRSPCGTGTSAKLACLYADGKLRPQETWRQESIVGTIFEGSIKIVGDDIIPIIRGQAFITAEATLILDEHDPFARGIRHQH